MKQKSEAEVVTEFAHNTVGNRQEIEASKYAGCVSCCATFDAKHVEDWRDEWTASEKQNRVRRWTAKCPQCGQPTVIGSSTGLLDDQAYLPVVKHILRSTSQAKRR